MLYNNGYWNDLFEECKNCSNLRIFSARMDGNHTYICTRYPLKDPSTKCPEFKRLVYTMDDEQMGVKPKEG